MRIMDQKVAVIKLMAANKTIKNNMYKTKIECSLWERKIKKKSQRQESGS